jgi:predicted transposase YdaD
LRQAIDAASIDEREGLMSNWVEDLIEQGLQQGLEKGKAEGLAEGLAEGKTEGKTEEAIRLVENLLQHRFGPLDAGLRARLAQLPVERLEALSTVILDARTLAEVNAFLADPAAR